MEQQKGQKKEELGRRRRRDEDEEDKEEACGWRLRTFGPHCRQVACRRRFRFPCPAANWLTGFSSAAWISSLEQDPERRPVPYPGRNCAADVGPMPDPDRVGPLDSD